MQDHLTHSGAQALASRIRAYWAERGVTVKTMVLPLKEGVQNVPGAVYCVRSTLSGKERDPGPLPKKAAA